MHQTSLLSQPTSHKYELLKIISYVLDIPVEKLYSSDIEISDDRLEQIQQLFKKYTEEKVPLEYLLGEVDFFGNKFFVNENVLIPRPETEYLVQYAIKEIKYQFSVLKSQFSIYDIGTGSGIIGISICKKLNLPVICSDISDKALEVAKKNAKKLGCGIIEMMSDDKKDKNQMISRRFQDDLSKGNKIILIKSDLAEHINNNEFKIICANLPYVPENFQIDEYAKKEPELALFAENEGLGLYEKLLNQIDNAILFLELTKKQAQKLVEKFEFESYEILETCHENIKILEVKI